MKRTSLMWTWGTAVVVGAACVSACQALAKVESRNTDPIAGGACALPSTGNGKMRLANLVPSAAKADFCVRATGAAWGRPILRDGGGDAYCRGGMAYEDVTIAFAWPSGTVDVKAIPAGSTCGAAATSEIDGVTLPSGTAVSFARIGGSAGVAEKMIALPEESSADVSDLRLRVVNAIAGAPAIDFGLSNSDQLPTTIDSPIFPQPVAFGGVEPPGELALGGSKVDANGYWVTLPQPLPYALANGGDTHAIIAFQASGNKTETVWAIGSAGPNADPNYPVKGLLCQEDGSTSASNALLASCVETSLPNLNVVTFNVSLYGANAPALLQRRPRLYDAVKNSTADMMCIVEAGDKSDRDQFAAAGKSGALAYSFAPTNDLSTRPTNDVDWSGNPPPPLPNPPCGGSVPVSDVNAAWDCAIQNCNTNPGDPNGKIGPGGTDCLSSKCPVQFGRLDSTSKPASLFCFECMAYNIATEQPFSQSETNCGQDTRRPFGFEGQNPSMVLSRYPFAKKSDGSDDVEQLVLPATGFRRSMLRAKIQLDAANTIDFYCAQFSSPLIETSLHYTGAYSNGASAADGGTENGWEDEQLLQASQVVPWVKQQSGTSPAILAGDWHAGRAATANGSPVLAALSTPVLDLLETTFTPVHAPTWQPTCNYCPPPADPYDSLTVGIDMITTYVFNMPPTATQERMLYVPDYNDPSTYVSIPPDPNQPNLPSKGPITEYFAREIHVVRPASK